MTLTDLVAESQPAHTTLAGQVLLYVIFPLVVALVLSLLGFGIWIVKKIGLHDQALAIIVHEVNPAGQPSLSATLTAIKEEQARVKQALLDQNKKDK